MKLSQFKFKLPDDKIALYPAHHRDESRMIVLHRKTGEIEHKMFKEIINYFDEHDVFVFNDTKVFPARLYGLKRKQVQKSKCSFSVNLIPSSACGTCLLTRQERYVSATSSSLARTEASWRKS